jgi:hypothetical protein
MIFMWELIQLMLILTVAILLIVNVVLPPWIGKPFFFMFRGSEIKLFKAKDRWDTTVADQAAEEVMSFLSDQTTRSRDYKPKKTVAKKTGSDIISNNEDGGKQDVK